MNDILHHTKTKKYPLDTALKKNFMIYSFLIHRQVRQASSSSTTASQELHNPVTLM